MLTKSRLVGALCTGGAMAVGVVLLGSSGASAGGTTTTLHYSFKVTSSAASELGKAGVVPGTEFAFAGEILSGSSTVGNFVLNCTADTGGNAAELECNASAWIGSGVDQLTQVGYVNLASHKDVYTVTGGSGRYFGMRGQMLADLNATGSGGTLTFQLES